MRKPGGAEFVAELQQQQSSVFSSCSPQKHASSQAQEEKNDGLGDLKNQFNTVRNFKH